MANIKFSQFTVGNTQSDIDFVVGYKGADNIQISPTNLLASSLGNYLPLAGGTMTGDILLQDSVIAKFGSSNDLNVYSNGSNSYIENFNGDLVISNTDNDRDIRFFCDDGAGGVTEYFRVDGGAEAIIFNNNTQHADNVKAYFGNAIDLQMFHNGTASFINNETGDLNIANYANDKDIRFYSDDGAGSVTEYFRLDGSTVRVESPKSFRFADGARVQLGSGSDMQIYYDGTNNIIDGGSTGINIDTYGDLNIGDLTTFNTYAGGFKVDMTAARQGLYNFEEAEWQLYSNANNEVFLLYSGNVKLETESYGIDVTGRIALNDGNNNVSVGDNAGAAITTGSANTLIGINAGDQITTESDNVAIGAFTLSAATPGTRNVAIGSSALNAQIAATNAYNIGIGYDAGKSITTGINNTIVGGQAGDAITTADSNVAIGKEAMTTNITSGRNVAIGQGSLRDMDNAGNAYNIGIGYVAGQSITSGSANTILGGLSGDAITVGSGNVVLGYGALTNETHGRNVAVGYESLGTQNKGSDAYNVAVGYQAGKRLTTGTENVFLGGLAGDHLTIGKQNVAVGYQALSSANAGDFSVAIGYAALREQTGAAAGDNFYNTAVGHEAGKLITTGDRNTLVGALVGDSLTTGQYNIAIGYQALQSEDTGNRAISIGYQALFSQNNNTDTYNTAIGFQAGNAITTGIKNTLLGGFAGDALTTGSNNIIIGYAAEASAVGASNEITLGDSNISLLRIPGLGSTDGHVLTYEAASGGIVLKAGGGGGGASSLNDLSDVTLDTTASPNSAYFINIPAGLSGNPAANFVMGAGAGNALTVGEGNTLIGVDAGKSIVDVDFNTMIGYRAGENVDPQTTTGNTFIGYEAGQGAVGSTAHSSVAIGYQALENINGGDYNVCVGALAGESVTNGSQNVMIGHQTGFNHTTNSGSTYIGYNTAVNLNASNTVAIGARSLFTLSGSWNSHCVVGEDACYATSSNSEHHAFGFEALKAQTSGQRNSAFGAEVMELLTTGVDNSAFGHNAGDKLTGDQNTLIGSSAGSSGTNDLTSGDANILIGYNSAASSATVSNEVNLYNGSVTARFQGAAAAWSFVSDARDKKDIEDLELGLDFVNKLKPRKFKWDLRDSDVDKDKEASGFIAQEVKEVLDEMKNDYTGIVDTNNPDQYTVSQANIIPMLVKAIQELKAEIELLKSK